jgi:DNA-binding CsgD family transcriptional regulator
LSRVIQPSDKLLDLIYDAAADEALWTPALIEIADVTGSLGGFVFGVENKARRVTFTFNGRMSEESHRVYRERHIVNAWSRYMNHCPVGKWVQSDEILPLTELKRTAFFDEVLRPQKMAHNAMVPLAAKDDFQVGFNVGRSERQGPFEKEVQRFFAQLYPHLRRSLLLGFRLDAYKALQHAQFDVLDRLSVGIILLDRAGKVVFANAAASEMSANKGPLRLRDSGVTTASAPHTQQLGQLIRAALRQVPVVTMNIPHPQDGHLVTVLGSSVRGRDAGRFADLNLPDAAVLLFILDPANRAGIPTEWIIDAYKLTPAEAKVALAASSGLTIPETAHLLGLSPNTIKTHLRKVFAKTGTRRQTELALLIDSIGLFKPPRSTGEDGK